MFRGNDSNWTNCYFSNGGETRGREIKIEWRFASTNCATVSSGYRFPSAPTGMSASADLLASRTAHVPEAFSQILRFVAANYMNPIQVTDVAEGVGMHPDHVSRVFQKVWGTSLLALHLSAPGAARPAPARDFVAED